MTIAQPMRSKGPGNALAARHPGLTSEEAARRLAADGPNELPTARKTPPWRLLLAQLSHLSALMLWAGGAAIVLLAVDALSKKFRANRPTG